MICHYCKAQGSEMFAILLAVKPKGLPYRWKRIGHCCDKCEQTGQPTKIEPTKSGPKS